MFGGYFVDGIESLLSVCHSPGGTRRHRGHRSCGHCVNNKHLYHSHTHPDALDFNESRRRRRPNAGNRSSIHDFKHHTHTRHWRRNNAIQMNARSNDVTSVFCAGEVLINFWNQPPPLPRCLPRCDARPNAPRNTDISDPIFDKEPPACARKKFH